MSLPNKRVFVLVSILSWLWLWSGFMCMPVHAAVPQQTSPGNEDMQESRPSGTNPQNHGASHETNQQQPSVVLPDTDTEHNQKLCEAPELIVAHCEPAPGSPLSASPLVLNLERSQPTASA